MLRLAILALLVGQVGCLNLDHPVRIGVELRAGDHLQLVAHYRYCNETVRLTRAVFQDANWTRADGADDKDLWEVVGSGPSRGSLIIGAPDSVDTELRLVREFDGSRDLSGRLVQLVIVTTALPQGESFTFDYDDLVVGRVLTKEGAMSLDEFAKPVACG